MGVRIFLLTGDDSNGSVSAFELFVPSKADKRLPTKTKLMRKPFTGLRVP